METKDQSTEVNQTEDLQDSTTAQNADTQESEKSGNTPENEKQDAVNTEETDEENSTEEAIVEEKEKDIVEAVTDVSTETASPAPLVSDEAEAQTAEVPEEQKEAELKKESETGEAIVEEKNKEIVEAITGEEQTEKLVAEVTEEDEQEDEAEDFSSYSLEQLVDRLIELVKTDDILSVKEKVGAIKANYIRKIKEYKQAIFDKFIEEGGEENEYKTVELPFEANYREAMKIYKEKRTAFLKKLEEEKEENLKKKEELLEHLRTMIKSDEPLKKTYDEFKKLQEQWREIGMVPQGKVKDLWENYHFLVDQFWDKVQISRELRDLDLRKNLEKKIELCEKVEELLLEKSINKSFKLLQEYHEKWREIGSVPSDKKDEIWERFKAATDKINKHRHEYYEKLHEEQKNNLLLKTALCEKMEEILEEERSSIKEWNAATEKVNALFAEWKTLGPAPKKHNDDIWKRFKTAMNTFFSNRKKYFKSLTEEQMNNYNLKLDICKQAEELKDSTEWKKTTDELIRLQKKWKEIGSVPRKYSDKIWKRFRAACDHFFDAKAEYFKNIGQVEEENLKLKKALIEKIKNFKFGDNKEENLKIIKDFQKQWSEIGRVPIKELNKIQKDFRKVIDKLLDELHIDSFEFQNMNLKSKIEKMKNKSEAKKTILREINFLKSKIDKIQSDVTLWENNMSFFANSKNADLLKKEFEKKIDRAKKEIDTFKAKIRHLDKMKRAVDAPPKEENKEESAE
jgi:hypothetical protein